MGTSVFAYRHRSWGPVAVLLGTIAAGIAFLACRTWYFTGSVNPLTGTQRTLLAI
jgi:hypothetical protein